MEYEVRTEKVTNDSKGSINQKTRKMQRDGWELTDTAANWRGVFLTFRRPKGWRKPKESSPSLSQRMERTIEKDKATIERLKAERHKKKAVRAAKKAARRER